MSPLLHPLNRAGPMRYTRKHREVYAFPLLHPWAWAVTDCNAPCLFTEGYTHPPDYTVGAMLALYALPREEAGAAAWIRRAVGLEAPPAAAVPVGGYLAVARLAEVSTFANDGRAFGREPWWSGTSPLRGHVALWLEELTVFEIIPDAEPAPYQRLGDGLFLDELRERIRVVQEGVFRHAAWKPPPPIATPPAVEEQWACPCGWRGPRAGLWRAPTAALFCPACRGTTQLMPETPGAKPLPIPFSATPEQASLL